ncbi:MAG: hypothetical protein KC561_21430, partial [Myxococcales bacterium]|nr:hypothetical protein [Myxococcales bacterium]
FLNNVDGTGDGNGVYARIAYGGLSLTNNTFSGGSSSGGGCDVLVSMASTGAKANVTLSHNTFRTEDCSSNVSLSAPTFGAGPSAMDAWLSGNLFATQTDSSPVQISGSVTAVSLGGNVNVGTPAWTEADDSDVVGLATGIGEIVDWGGHNVVVPLLADSNALFASGCRAGVGRFLNYDQTGAARIARVDGSRVCTAGAYEPTSTPITTTAEREPDETCENGGVDIVSGFDVDGDGELSGAEVVITRPICNQGA